MTASPVCRRDAATPMMVRIKSRMSAIYSTAPCCWKRAEHRGAGRITGSPCAVSVDGIAQVDGGVEDVAGAVVPGNRHLGGRGADQAQGWTHSPRLVAGWARDQQCHLYAHDVGRADLVGGHVGARRLCSGRIDAI